jgi:hypothetical protein
MSGPWQPLFVASEGSSKGWLSGSLWPKEAWSRFRCSAYNCTLQPTDRFAPRFCAVLQEKARASLAESRTGSPPAAELTCVLQHDMNTDRQMILYAFVDEYGQPSLAVENEGVTTFFIVTALLVEATELDRLRQGVELIRSTEFGLGEMKSSGVGPNIARRERILERLATLGLRSYTLAVDKRELTGAPGLRFRRSFLKYVNRKLYERLFRAFDQVLLIADEHGSAEFMEGFRRYAVRRLPLQLFGNSSFDFGDSRSEVLLQAADFVAGSWARVLDPKKAAGDSVGVLQLLQTVSVSIEVWPPATQVAVEKGAPAADHDRAVAEFCWRQAVLFVREHENEEETPFELAVQIELVNLLLFEVQFGRPAAYVGTRRLRSRLRQVLSGDISERAIRNAVSRLRDGGVVIATSPRGYKIPVSVADVASFVRHANSIVPPMLSRVAKARSDLLLASRGELDILQADEFDQLRAAINRHQGSAA